jgi:mono/diheme cytochrome c family protein
LPKRSEIPVEEREYGHIYLILAGLLALTTFWAIVDMISIRAPWQRYQKKLNQLEYERVEAQLTAAQEELEQKHGDHRRALAEQLRREKANLEGQAYETLQADIKKADFDIEKAMQEYRFAKSEYDALWYEYKHAEHAGHQSKAQSIRPKVDALNEEAAKLKLNWDNAEAKKVELEARLARYNNNVDSLQKELDSMLAPIDELKTKLHLIDNRKIAIQQFVLPSFVRGNFENFLDQVDRCTSCHVNTEKGGYEDYPAPFQTHPNREIFLKTHPTNRFGCAPCHEGQGPALQSVKFAHGFVKYWEHPLLEGEFLQAGCNKCHSKEMKVEHAPLLTKAKRMVFDLGCYGCHEIAGYETARKIGPPLNSVSAKTTPEFIYHWVKDTQSFRQHSRMPNPQFSHQEALAVTAYLVNINKKSTYATPAAPQGGSVQRGEELVESLGCKGCHVITETDREVRQSDVPYDIAPELTKIGSKINRDWLFAWIKNPKQYHPQTTMPSLRLTDSEAQDITAYLMTRKETETPPAALDGVDLGAPELIAEGKAVIRNFGCHGCHDIAGMETEGKVSVSLNEFGGKTHEELFYGDALARGDVAAETWEDWTIGKLQNSRLYATEVVVQRMPNFAMSKEEATTLAVLLKSWDGRFIGKTYLHDMGRMGEAIEKGRRLVRQYNCVGCHIIEGEGGFIRPTLVAAFKKQNRSADEAISFAPPDLIGEGRKVQPTWLFEFLKNPTTNIRPWLSVRMPTFSFTDVEVNALIEYFQALEGISEPFQEIKIDLTNEEIKAAEKLFSENLLSCFSCHQVGKKKPEGPPDGWAPDFLLAPARLRPDWVYDWIANPPALQPGTRMPAFYPDAAPPEVFNGDPDKQIEALRDYIMNIRRFVTN